MARPRPIHNLGKALSLLTALPVRQSKWDGPAPQVAAWFPAVGALYGLAGYAIVKASVLLHIQTGAPYVVATLVVIVWALMSRMLHWDGLADVADGYWGSHDKARRLEIMADSHTGAFGVTAVTLAAILEVLAIGLIIRAPHEFIIFLVPILSRSSATAAAWFGSPAREGGLGRFVIGRPRWGSALIALVPVVLVIAALLLGYHSAGQITSVVGLLTALSVPALLSRRFGGVTGDVMGASVLITEVAVFTVFALAMVVECP